MYVTNFSEEKKQWVISFKQSNNELKDICFVVSYYRNDEAVAKGMVKALNNSRIKLNLDI